MKKHLRLAILTSLVGFLAIAAPTFAIPPPVQDCPEGWGGPNCDEPSAVCEPNPCEHGTCWPLNASFKCFCYESWAGTLCDAPDADHMGMTFTLLNQYSGSVSHVGADAATNAYHGDTPPWVALPILCINVDNSAPPAGFTPTSTTGWSKGQLALTAPVYGSALVNTLVANDFCIDTFGWDWRMAEFHDSWHGTGLTLQGGWSFLGYGNISPYTRFWVYINDTPANPWD